MNADMGLIARAGELTKAEGLETARQKLTLLVLADWLGGLRSVALAELAEQTVQTEAELKVTLLRLRAKGLITFAGFGIDATGTFAVLVDVALHLPEAS